MAVSGRTSKISAVVAAICIVIYVLAIASAAVQIIENIGERRSLAETEFYDLADQATQSAVFLGFMSGAYQETIRDFIADSETLLGVIISGSSGEYAFERFQGSGIVWNGDSPRFKSRAGFPREPFYLPLRIEGQRNVNIQAIYSSLDNGIFLKVLRNTLLAILAALSIALIALMVELTRKKKAGNVRPQGPAAEAPKRREVEIIRRPDFGETIKSGPEPASDEFPDFEENEDALSIPEDDEEEPEFPEEDNDDFADDFPVNEAGEEVEHAGEETPGSRDEKGPTGLFTPRGNIGWESYTQDRLDSELHRCASFEQDLVFLAIELKNGSKLDDKLYRQFTEEAVNFFSSRDLVFEKGENGASIIIPSMNLEQGIAKSEDFRGRMVSKLAESFKGQLTIGLSSRSGRLIEADRLMLESFKALEKAKEDPASPIVAFKSDPEKYREFVTKAGRDS